jgi:hypothetical protein
MGFVEDPENWCKILLLRACLFLAIHLKVFFFFSLIE